MGSRRTSTTAMPGCRYGGQAAPPKAMVKVWVSWNSPLRKLYSTPNGDRQDACATLGAGTPNIEPFVANPPSPKGVLPKWQGGLSSLSVGKFSNFADQS